MTSARQIKQVYGPLLSRHQDLFQVGTRWLCIKPVHHIALRILIESSSHADYASPQWVMRPTFLLSSRLEISIGCHFWHLSRSSLEKRSWLWSDPSMVDDLINVIENEALPILRSVKSLVDYGPLYHRRLDGSFLEAVEDRMIICIALGELEEARKICLGLLPEYAENKNETWPRYQYLRSKVMAVAKPLLCGDKNKLATILHGWEAASIRGTKFEPYWKPTPFPLEAG